jgi:signal transduction histidine kinase
MAGMVRAFDWSKTTLGPIDRWPPGLVSAIGLCLHSRFQSAVYAGRELLFIYNDAERDILGQLHPDALGLPAHELLRDSWAVVEPELRAAMADGRSTWAVDRPLTFDFRGRKELIYFTYSYSPIFEADGGVSGVLLITQDTTARVLAERRLETLTEVTTRAMDAPTEQRACELAVDGLEGRPDVGFVLVYLVEGSSGRASCVAATTGMEKAKAGDVRCSGQRIRFEHGEWSGPLIDLRTKGVVVDARDALPPWADPRSLGAKVFVGPIVRGTAEPPVGYMVAGLSEDRMFDRPYEAFLGTLGVGIGRSVAAARARQAERERASAIAALDKAKTALYNNVSHELRTPLALILGHLEELRQDIGLSFHGREGLAVASRSALRMLKLVNALLEFSRIEAGEQVGAFRPTDVAQLTRDVAAMFRSTAERAGLRLSVDCCSLPDPLNVDSEAWERIVSNLISNAIKFTPEGEISVRIAVEGDHLCLSVADTGIGIPDHDRERVFSRFYRGQRWGARTHEGSGIGLALVRELVRLHAGSVEASSRPGGGTLMMVRVPLDDGKRVGEVSADDPYVEVGGAARDFIAEADGWFERPDVAAGPSNGSPRTAMTAADSLAHRDRIVLVEDNPDMREYLRRLLASSYTVELVRDGMQARELLRRDPPAMVISDVMLPGLDGLALVSELRQAAVTRNVPVILVSARADRDSMAAALELGADDYIVKPFGARELLARVGAALENARARATAGVTQGRQAEREIKDAELRGLLNDLKAAQLRVVVSADGERRKIEQNLHDGAQQQLLALHVRLQSLADSVDETDTVLRSKILRLQEDLDEAVAELRELAHGVYPALLTDQGLYAAVVARARRQLNPVTVSGADIGRVRPEIENAVYFCCTEALQNVAKHAGPSAHGHVDLNVAYGVLEFEVRDDGCGFEPRGQPPGNGFLNLRDRVEAVGGTLDIDSQPGHGTTVHGRIPLV